MSSLTLPAPATADPKPAKSLLSCVWVKELGPAAEPAKSITRPSRSCPDVNPGPPTTISAKPSPSKSPAPATDVPWRTELALPSSLQTGMGGPPASLDVLGPSLVSTHTAPPMKLDGTVALIVSYRRDAAVPPPVIGAVQVRRVPEAASWVS